MQLPNAPYSAVLCTARATACRRREFKVGSGAFQEAELAAYAMSVFQLSIDSLRPAFVEPFAAGTPVSSRLLAWT